jgi:hypothetical protein
MVMVVTCMSAPPAVPCKARPAMRIDMLEAVAQMIELAKNHATATNKTGLRPQMSESLAQMGAPEALARRYAEPTHV